MSSTFTSPSSCYLYVGGPSRLGCTSPDTNDTTSVEVYIDDLRVHPYALSENEIELLAGGTP